MLTAPCWVFSFSKCFIYFFFFLDNFLINVFSSDILYNMFI